MQRIDWVETMLLNWARWKVARGGGALGYAALQLGQTNGGRSGFVTATIPISDVEASKTEDAVKRIEPMALRRAVEEHYTGDGTTGDKCKALGCSRAALTARIACAHRILADDFIAQRQKALAEAARIKALQNSAREVKFSKRSFTP